MKKNTPKNPIIECSRTHLSYTRVRTSKTRVKSSAADHIEANRSMKLSLGISLRYPNASPRPYRRETFPYLSLSVLFHATRKRHLRILIMHWPAWVALVPSKLEKFPVLHWGISCAKSDARLGSQYINSIFVCITDSKHWFSKLFYRIGQYVRYIFARGIHAVKNNWSASADI